MSHSPLFCIPLEHGMEGFGGRARRCGQGMAGQGKAGRAKHGGHQVECLDGFSMVRWTAARVLDEIGMLRHGMAMVCYGRVGHA